MLPPEHRGSTAPGTLSTVAGRRGGPVTRRPGSQGTREGAGPYAAARGSQPFRTAAAAFRAATSTGSQTGLKGGA